MVRARALSESVSMFASAKRLFAGKIVRKNDSPRCDWAFRHSVAAIRCRTQIKFGDKNLRGYWLSDFGHAFARYLPLPPFPGCYGATTLGKTPIFRVLPDDARYHPE